MAYSLKTQKILHHNHKQEDKWGQDPCGSPWHSKIESRLGLQCWASLFTVIYKISFIRASAIIGGIDQAMSSCAPPTSRQYFFELMESRSHFKDFHLKQCKVLKTRSVRPTCQQSLRRTFGALLLSKLHLPQHIQSPGEVIHICSPQIYFEYQIQPYLGALGVYVLIIFRVPGIFELQSRITLEFPVSRR